MDPLLIFGFFLQIFFLWRIFCDLNQRRWECLNMRMLADPALGWKGGMRPVIKCSTPGEECLNGLNTGM
jgi:hypothetical protein